MKCLHRVLIVTIFTLLLSSGKAEDCLVQFLSKTDDSQLKSILGFATSGLSEHQQQIFSGDIGHPTTKQAKCFILAIAIEKGVWTSQQTEDVVNSKN